jgi:hypothetical protein
MFNLCPFTLLPFVLRRRIKRKHEFGIVLAWGLPVNSDSVPEANDGRNRPGARLWKMEFSTPLTREGILANGDSLKTSANLGGFEGTCYDQAL